MKITKLYSPNYLLIIILVTGAILRLNHINQPYIDYASWRETSTAMIADNYYRRNWNIFYPEVSWNGPGLSYQGREFQTITYLAAILYTFLGQHDWIGRTLAVLFWLWGIFALYKLTRLVCDEKHALMSAAVMAVLPGSIFIERSFLPDPAMVSLVITSFWFLIAYCESDRLYYLFLAIIFGIWGFLTKLPGLMVGIPMLYSCFTILSQRNKLTQRKYLTIAITIFCVLIPVIAYYFWAKHLALTYPPYHFAGGGNWVWDDGVNDWIKRQYFLPSLFWNLKTWLWTKPIIILFIIGVVSPPLNNNYNKAQAPWLFHWWLCAGVIYYLIGAKELVINSWNFHIINPTIAVLAGRGIITIGYWIEILINFIQKKSLPKKIVQAVLLIFFIYLGNYSQKKLIKMYYPTQPIWNAKESYYLGLALEKISSAKDLVVTIPNDIGEPVAVYYSKRRGWVFPPPWDGVVWWSDISEDDNKLITLFQELRIRSADWFGIVAEHRNNLKQNRPQFMQYVETTCQIVEETSDYTIYKILPNQNITPVSHN